MEKKIISYSDGGARGNPGPAGIGAILCTCEGELLAEISEYLGVSTNNQAEYRALIAALEKAIAIGAKRIDCHLDSELVVKQLNGDYKVKNLELKPLFLRIQELRCCFESICFIHVRREYNKQADALANRAMDLAK
jgi:ribonuclease HI